MTPQAYAGHQPRSASAPHHSILTRRADGRDAEVGRRVRSRRLECNLSQTELASRIGITFQQVQKYEKGANRIGAGRLQRISEALEVPVSFFFSAQPVAGKSASQVVQDDPFAAASIFALAQSRGAVRLLQAFHKIGNAKAKQSLIDMAESLAAE